MGLIVIGQSLTVLIAPLLGVLILVMANKASLMGELRNRWWQNLFGAIGLIATVDYTLMLWRERVR